jgi:hypothetical protein
MEIKLSGHVKDITKEKFYYLTVLKPAYKKNRTWYWKVKCKCGNTKVVCGNHLRLGKIKSCGCYNSKIHQTHGLMCVPKGMSRHPLANIWRNMISRCCIETSPNYHSYGGRGIKICNRWMNFQNFIEDLPKRPSLKHTIDRIDNDGNYEPVNVKWSTPHEQHMNTTRNKIL